MVKLKTNPVLETGNKPVVIDPENMSNEEIVSLIKRLAVILRDRTASEIAEIRRKKELVDKKAGEIRSRLYKARAEANKHLSEFLMKIAKEFSGIVKIDKNGAVRIPSSVIKELGGIQDTKETERLQRMLNALVSASEHYRAQLKALGYGTVNIHENHIYIKLPKKREQKEDTIERLKELYLKYTVENTENSESIDMAEKL